MKIASVADVKAHLSAYIKASEDELVVALWEFPPKGRYLVVEGYRPKTAYPPKSSVIRWKMCFRLKMP